MEGDGDRFIATIDQSAFEQQTKSSRSTGSYGGTDDMSYRQTLSSRMGLGNSVFVYQHQQQLQQSPSQKDRSAPPTPQQQTSPFQARAKMTSPPPASGTRTPPMQVPAFDLSSGFSPMEVTPGEWTSGGQTTPRKQTGSLFENENTSSPPSTGFHAASNTRSPVQSFIPRSRQLSPNPNPQFTPHGTPSKHGFPSPSPSTRTPLMSSPLHHTESPAGGSPFNPTQHRSATPTLQHTGGAFQPRVLRSPAPSTSRKRDGVTPSKILDAKGIANDLDTSVLAWGKHCLIVGLGNVVYMWTTDDVKVLFEGHSNVSAVACSPPFMEETYVVAALEDGLMHYFHFSKPDEIKSHPPLVEHGSKVSAVALHRHILYSATNEGVFSIIDLRSKQTIWRTTLSIAIYTVCVTHDGNHIALGTAAGVTVLHSSNLNCPSTVFTSSFPVRAVGWAPHCDVGLLAFCAGCPSNNELIVYSLGSGVKAACDVSAEACSLLWSESDFGTPEIVVGFGSSDTPQRRRSSATPQPENSNYSHSLENCVGIFEFHQDSKLRKISTIVGHQERILHCALSPDGNTLCTGAGGEDATLRFWNVVSRTPKHIEGGCEKVPRAPLSTLFEDDFRN